MNQCLICGHIYSLIVTPVMIGQVIKEENTKRNRIIRNMSKWYWFHLGTKEVSDGVTKEY